MEKRKPIGKEITYESLDETGKAIFLDDQLVHCYYYFSKGILNLIKELNSKERPLIHFKDGLNELVREFIES